MTEFIAKHTRIAVGIASLLLVGNALLGADEKHKLPPPTADQQASALKVIRDVYKPEAAKTTAARKATG